MEKIPASVGILTFNNAGTIERALESVAMFDDIVICDGGSTDRTLEIAKRYGARIIAQDQKFKNANGTLRDFGGVRQQLLDAARHDWFLYIDSDEAISDGLRGEIESVVSKPLTPESPLVYRVPIGIVLDGRQIKYSSNFPGYQHRFFSKRSGAHFIKPVHERITFDTKRVRIGTFKNPWNTYATQDEVRHYPREMKGYRVIQARMSRVHSFREYLVFDVYRTFRAAFAMFVKACYIYLRHGFKESAPISMEWGRVTSTLMLIGDITVERWRSV